MSLRRLPRPTAHTRAFRRMPSERTCLHCGCVKARHPERYCTFHGPFGPTGCKRYRGVLDVVLYVGWAIALLVWLVALSYAWKAVHVL